MKKIETVFLAGPDTWSPDAAEVLAIREEVCQAMGFRGVSPKLGAGLEEEQRSEVTGRSLYAEALALPSDHDYGNGVAIFTRDGDAFACAERPAAGRRDQRGKV